MFWHYYNVATYRCVTFTMYMTSPLLLCSQTIQQRGAAVIKARKLSSAMSAAKAICDHLRDWWFGTRPVSHLTHHMIYHRLPFAAIT